MVETEKLCKRCGLRPPRPRNSNSGPHPVLCALCIPYRRTPEENAEYFRDYHRKRRARGKGKKDDQARAHELVADALATGEIVPKPCAVCRSEVQLQAHHHDYGQPLNVTWLCQPHHFMIDQLEGLRAVEKYRLVDLLAWCPPRTLAQELLFV
jgi:hypothetical protein